MDNIAIAVEDIRKLALSAAVKYDEPLKKYTTFKIGGPVRAIYFPEDEESTVLVLDVLRGYNIEPYIMGAGSNILADDAALDIVVINMLNMKEITLTETVNDDCSDDYSYISAQSGLFLSEISLFAENHKLAGFEFAAGIPGTLGGAVYMNAGAYGGEMKDVVESTKAYNPGNGIYTVTGDGHKFSYRASVFTGSSDIILSSIIKLQKGNRKSICRRLDDYAARRRKTQPLDEASAGSTFKRPAEGYAAALIEQAGLKGFSIGGAGVSDKHAGFVVNKGNAAFADVMAVIEHVQKTVEKNTGILLEPEVKIWRA